ncbi:uncharacterized protein N7500_003641 [Penicillium coprophilum]|uniref:uncharacterized protein n=1 Tax=Penicillium coprophilum TaxID=36646 RepID=UPI00239DDBD4|nr:uncharacterized protein N7500_003641 [Penicillium coprophilum]KAJ5170858.1 hypothetical protein N7500_003641 [Penicillium coprophilum]
MSAPIRSRKRTKTFTGCWTCRTRKIKCDELKPCCGQCYEKGLSCEGYSARLQWLTPATGKRGLRSVDPPGGSISQSLRRLMPPEPLEYALDWDQVDGILHYLDSLESVLNPRSEDVSANIQNFGVFRVQPNTSSGVDQLNTTTPCATEVCQPGNGYDLIFEPESVSIQSESWSDNSEAGAAWSLCTLHGQPLNLDFTQQDLAPAVVQRPPGDVSNSPARTYHIAQAQPLESDGLILSQGVQSNRSNETQSVSPRLTNTLESLVVPSQERLLMRHYSHRVVNLFCVIDNSKSPWKTIHLPRVLQSAGELSFGCTTTRIRDALKYSLLSISAFCLSNDHKSHRREEEAKNWCTIASRYRCDAIGLLKYAVETDLYADKRPKYKEFLATMLSMITINVMSGDTSTCSVHLDGAEKLISHMNTRKATFSRKAQSLHRIYLYLRVIYESTAARRSKGGISRFSPSLGSQRTFGPQPVFPTQHLFIEDDETPSSMLPMGADTMIGESTLPEMSAYECIYGIPQSLLILLKESIEVIDEVNHHRMSTEEASIPECLNQICDDLEQKIMDWPLDERLHRYEESTNGISATIIYHQTRAFLNALIIYFSQSVRLMSHRYLRQYVQAILDSIEAIEQLKEETKILAAPLFWPAFMGATEAFEPKHQERFRLWYERVEVYGIEAVRTGIQVVHEVWRRGPTTNRHMRSGWRSVVEQTGDHLMLT